MKLCAIISEFNPFTNGHEYIISQAKQKTGLDVVCLMSGNAVQRGEFALQDKYTRATNAIKGGASLVIELPTIDAVSSAKYFARGAIRALMNYRLATHLCFGVRTDNTKFLISLAKLKAKEPEQLKTLIKENTDKGLNYNQSVQNALKLYLPKKHTELDQIFNDANNILALEYLTAIYEYKAKIKPVFVNRLDNGYNSDQPFSTTINGKQKTFAPASLVRQKLEQNQPISEFVPEYTLDSLKNINASSILTTKAKYEALVLNKLRNTRVDYLAQVCHNTPLANLIMNNAKKYSTLTEIVENSTAKCFKQSRINQTLLLNLLDINYNKLYTSSINVLAIKKDKKELIKEFIKDTYLQVIVSSKDLARLDQNRLYTTQIDQQSSNIFNIINSKPQSQDLCVFVD